MGRAYDHSTYLEDALKMEELAYVHSEGILAGHSNSNYNMLLWLRSTKIRSIAISPSMGEDFVEVEPEDSVKAKDLSVLIND